MFNAPRATQRYSTSGSFGSGSFSAEGPLSTSTYDGLDPWSSAPTPELPPPPSAQPPPSPFTSVIADAVVPPIYENAFNAVDTTGTGEVSLSALSRILALSGLPASAIDRIVNLVSSRPRVSKLEFYVALALVALVQTGKDASVEQVAALAAQNALPVPTLDLSSLASTTSTIAALGAPPMYRRESNSVSDPWSAPPGGLGAPSLINGASSTVSGSGLPREWWRRQEKVQIRLLGMQGFILNRYYVFEISTERGNPVSRRYSEFVFLWDCLVHRYPFRILPQLPPKRIGPDEYFLEQRRRGLVRFLNFVINHPIIKEDGVLAVFLTEPSLEQWRKHNAVSLDEESLSKRVDPVTEMSIPSDLEEKLAVVREKLGLLIEQWQKICILAERIIKRREAAAVRSPQAIFKRSFLSAYLDPSASVSSAPPSSATASITGHPPSPRSLASSTLAPSMAASMTGSMYGAHSAPNTAGNSLTASIFGSLHIPTAPLVGSRRPDGAADGGFYTSYYENPQADLSRLTLTLNTLSEANARCWRGDGCELCSGVRTGVDQVSAHIARQAEEVDARARNMSVTTLEALKMQRDLHIAVRDLFVRHDRLSGDPIDRLKKRIETNQMRLEGIRSAAKEGWEVEVDKLSSGIERDQASITSFLHRRVFIRYSMWHELRVVLHNRENTLLTQLVREFAKEEATFSEVLTSNWTSLAEAVENMPYE